MENNSIVPAFDDVTNEHLVITLNRIQEVPKCLVVYLRGYIDHSNFKFFQDRMDQLISVGYISLILNCLDCRALSDTAAVAFMNILKNIHERKGVMTLVNVQSSLYQLLELTGVPQIFNCKQNLEEAL